MVTASCPSPLRPDSPFSPAPPVTLPPAGLPTRRGGDGGAGDSCTGYTPPPTPARPPADYQHAAAAGEPCMALALAPPPDATRPQPCAPSQALVPVLVQPMQPPAALPPSQGPWFPTIVRYANPVAGGAGGGAGSAGSSSGPSQPTSPRDAAPLAPWLPTVAPTLYSASRHPTPADTSQLALAPYSPRQPGPQFIDSAVSLRSCRSRELIQGDIVKCTCSKRNGLQDDCRHTVCASPDCIYRAPHGSVYWTGQSHKLGQSATAPPAGQPSSAVAAMASGLVVNRLHEEEHLSGPGAVPVGDGAPPPFAAYAHAHAHAPAPPPFLAPPQAQGDGLPCTAVVPYNPQAPAALLSNHAAPTFAEYQTHLANIYASLDQLNQCLREINQKALGPHPAPPGGLGAPGPPPGMSIGEYTQAVGNFANNLGELQNKLGQLNNSVYNPNGVANATNPLYLDTSVYLDPQLAGAYGVVGGGGGGGGGAGGGGYLVGGAGDGGGQWFYPHTWHAHAYPMGVQQAADAQHHSWPGAQAAWAAANQALNASQPPPAPGPAHAWPSAPHPAGAVGTDIVRGPDNVPFKSCNGL